MRAAARRLSSGPAHSLLVRSQFVWAAILAGGLFFLPESPRWLLVTGRDERARTSLARLFRLPENSPYVAEEYANIAANVHHESTLGKISYARLLFKSDEQRLPLRVWTGCALQALQQLSGINFSASLSSARPRAATRPSAPSSST